MASTAEFQRIDLDKLTLFHRNARRGDVDAIAESLTANGQYAPVTVNVGTLTGRPYEVLAGNHTTMAARQVGWSSIDCYVIDVDDEHATRINLNANKLTQLGGFDNAELDALLSTFEDLAGTGYTPEEVDAIHALITPPTFDPDPFSEPEPEQSNEPAPKSSDESVPGASGPRSITLSGLPPKYRTWLGDTLARIVEENDMDTPAEALVMIVMSFTGTKP